MSRWSPAPTRPRSPRVSCLQRLDLLRAEDADHPAEHRFYSSGDISWFADLGGRLLGPELGAADHWQPPE